LCIKAGAASTGAATLNVTPASGSALGAKAIRRQGDTAIVAKDMLANGYYVLRYDEGYNSSAGAWVLCNPAVDVSTYLPLAGGTLSGDLDFNGNDATNLASVNGGQLSGFRNKIRNGNFNVNQRAVSGTVTLSAGVYGHDGWKAGASGCTYTFATSGGVTTLTISAGTLQQVIEGGDLISGGVVLSWSGTANGKIDSGTSGASPRTGTATGGTNMTIEFATGTVSKVQLEPGSQATTFEQRPLEVELQICKRHLRAYGGDTTFERITEGRATGSTGGTYSVPLDPEMRAVPSLSISAASNFAVTDGGIGSHGLTGLTLDSASTKRVAILNGTGASGLTSGQGSSLQTNNTTSARLYLSAEL
jgi:hypothetical protein